MPERNITPLQQHFKDVTALHKAGIPLTPQELASATGGDTADLTGIHVVHGNPELRRMGEQNQERLLRMAGMAGMHEGPIGAALLLEDAKRAVTHFVGILHNLHNSNKSK